MKEIGPDCIARSSTIQAFLENLDPALDSDARITTDLEKQFNLSF